MPKLSVSWSLCRMLDVPTFKTCAYRMLDQWVKLDVRCLSGASKTLLCESGIVSPAPTMMSLSLFSAALMALRLGTPAAGECGGAATASIAPIIRICSCSSLLRQLCQLGFRQGLHKVVYAAWITALVHAQ